MSLVFMERDMYFSVRDHKDEVLGWLIKPDLSNPSNGFVFSGQVTDEEDLNTADFEEAVRKVTALVVAHRLTAP